MNKQSLKVLSHIIQSDTNPLMRPFWVFDKIDPEGFKIQNQSNRFAIRERVDTGDRLSVDLIIK